MTAEPIEKCRRCGGEGIVSGPSGPRVCKPCRGFGVVAAAWWSTESPNRAEAPVRDGVPVALGAPADRVRLEEREELPLERNPDGVESGKRRGLESVQKSDEDAARDHADPLRPTPDAGCAKSTGSGEFVETDKSASSS